MRVDVSELRCRTYHMALDVVRATTAAGSGHPTTCLSAAALCSVAFFYAMRYRVYEHDYCNNDRFILSKGHAAPLLYAVWRQLGVVSDDELMSLRSYDSVLEGHPTPRFSRSEAATGSLGQGLSIGCGMACAALRDGLPYTTYVLLGDSELAEGSVWEAAYLAAYYRCDNLIAIVDINRLGQSTQTIDGHDLSAYAAKFEAFGWHVIQVPEGHNESRLIDAYDQAHNSTGTPTVILAQTVKGYGLPEHIAGKMGYHGTAFSREDYPACAASLAQTYADVSDMACDIPASPRAPYDVACPRRVASYETCTTAAPKQEAYPTRKAYGDALAACGVCDDRIIALDAEVKNSTYAETFEREHPERFYQCFIAEQNMIGMATGFALRGFVPFASTFSSFMSRAHDQLRMAAIGRVPLRIVGSHAGVSIGADGPSQMGLEDIAMVRSLPNSVVLYPCDGIATQACVRLMVGYDRGISYLRTTRMATPYLYQSNAQFAIGGCHVVRQAPKPDICVCACGITVHTAYEACQQLAQEGISVRLIDCYCIKPLPVDELCAHIRDADGHVCVAEDHYQQGGLGEAIACSCAAAITSLSQAAVGKIPRSGSPDELLSAHGLSADSLAATIRRQLSA